MIVALVHNSLTALPLTLMSTEMLSLKITFSYHFFLLANTTISNNIATAPTIAANTAGISS
jgi:hypothetical protein